MSAEKDVDQIDTPDSVKNTVPNHGYSLRKGDFAQRPMSIKKFLEPFDHSSLTNNEAGEKYAAYKASFARQQLEEFFERNKSYAWFREKYHPDYLTESSSSMKLFRRRLDIFMEFYRNGYFDNLHLASGYESEIVRLLDMVAIKLAGGTEEDFILLDKLLEDRISEDPNVIIEPSNFQHTENVKPNNNIVQSSDIREGPFDKEKFDASTMKKKPKPDYCDSSKIQKRKEFRIKRRQNNADEEEEGEDSSLSDDESNDSGTDSVNSHSRDSSSSNNNSTSGSSSSSDSSDDDNGSSNSSNSSSSSTDDDDNNNNNNKEHQRKVSISKSNSSDSSDGETVVKHKKKRSKLVKNKNVQENSGHSGDRHRRRHHRHHDDNNNNHDNVHNKVNPISTNHLYNNDHNDQQNKSDCSKVVPDEINTMSSTKSPNTTGSNQSNEVYVLSGLTDPPYVAGGVVISDDTHNNSITNDGEKSMDFDNLTIEKSADPINKDELKELIVTNEQTRRPIHYTTLLFFPHIPFNIFKRDLISVLSTCPHFLRLAILDPVIMPDTVSSITDDQIFGRVKNPMPKILLKRMGWASFTSQYIDDVNNKWISIDLIAIKNKLIEYAVDREASSDLIECLRLSRPILDHLKVPHEERARKTGHLFDKLLSVCPTRIRSKALARRHLVIAARVIYDFDKARGLWSTTEYDTNDNRKNDNNMSADKERGKGEHINLRRHGEVSSIVDDGEEEGEDGGGTTTSEQKEKIYKETLTINKLFLQNNLGENDINHSSNQDRSMDIDQSLENEETMEEQNNDSDVKESSHQKTHKSSSLQDSKNSSDVSMLSDDEKQSDFIDPGDDLIKAANILNSIKTINPLLQGLTDYLVDEGNAEEELLLLGGMQSISFQPPSITKGTLMNNSQMINLHSSLQLQQLDISSRFCESDDSELLVVLDRLILYLRIVHSVDFYAPAFYMNEDLMPHPCRLIHIRPGLNEITKALTQVKSPEKLINSESVDHLFASQIKRLVRLITPLTENDCKGLGYRNADDVVEEFIKLNTRRKKRKADVIWVCPLSNKKFRDPIYVKKHILNKHMEKVEAAKKDNAYFFNNYLMDPARPQLPPEPRSPRRRSQSPSPSRRTARESSHLANETSERERSNSWAQGSNNFQSQRWQQYGRNRNEGGNMGGNYGRDNIHSNLPFYPRPYGRQQYSNFRIPYGGSNQRSYYNGPRTGGYNFNRRGYPRRSYVDLDAP
ncbi:hypothetical protein MS3_00008637 [Schistosoma haematobium]|uniref:Serrate RNA effector molecule-like protein n=1 Tax=Schistosoma haematobium TaxID=6185 RepID=A0A094ZHB3_SCHHA|nr:hypothetical protein MS3_00008637 [Schistosoma haematobium]KAH9581528.1 hypothetical protein MS3_00008637 [Schistosoma haematobium]CAH8618313.1 unnamed protein product [Schistosoma haematobium]